MATSFVVPDVEALKQERDELAAQIEAKQATVEARRDEVKELVTKRNAIEVQLSATDKVLSMSAEERELLGIVMLEPQGVESSEQVGTPGK